MTRARLVLGLAAVAVTASGLVTLATAGSAAPVAPGPMAQSAAQAAMLDLEGKIDDHQRSWGAVAATIFNTPDKVPGDIAGSGGYYDAGGLWTGVFMGGESLRYATANRYLASDLSDSDRAFWTAQRDSAYQRVSKALYSYHVNINIAESWRTQAQAPKVNYDPTKGNPAPNSKDQRSLVDFGGGVVQGEKGMLMRSCSPQGDYGGRFPDWKLGVNNGRDFERKDYEYIRQVGPLHWTLEDGTDSTWVCDGAPSRDSYAGYTFGMLTAYDMLPAADPLRAQIRADLHAMGEFIYNHATTYVRPHGNVSAYHFFDNFISPDFMAQVPMARLNLANAVRKVVDDGDDPVAKAKWDAIWAEEVASQLASGSLAVSMEVDSLQPNEGYYKFNLHHLTAFNLLRTTTGPIRDLVLQAVSVLDKTTGDDVNAHFESIIFSQTGDTAKRDAAVEHLSQWLDYRAERDAGHDPHNSARCGHDIQCKYVTDYGVVINGQEQVFKPHLPAGESNGTVATQPLPVAQRPEADFLWQREPGKLDGGNSPYEREPGIDYLTPYWVLRYFTEVAPPASTPLPFYPGPGHR